MAHHDRQPHDAPMMWLMVAGCLAPLLVLALLGGGLSFGASWPPLIGLVAMVLGHWWLMRRGHGAGEHSGQASPRADDDLGGDGERPADRRV